MIAPDKALAALAELLETPVPTPEKSGAHIFPLSEDMRLGVEFLPGGAGVVAWSEAGAAEGRDAEDKAADFLRLHLARLCGAPGIEAALDAERLLLFWRGRPETAREWIDAVAALLNEAEASRRVSATSAGGGHSQPAAESLFAGMAGWIGTR